MVILEAAAITAGGIAAFKGGKAAVKETTKKVKTKLKLSNQEKDRKETYDSRKQERKERFSQINQYRDSFKKADSKSEGVTLPSFNWGKSADASGLKSSTSSSRVGARAASSTAGSRVGARAASSTSVSSSGGSLKKQSSSSKFW